MNVGDIFYNTQDEPSLPGVPPFKKGFYKVISIRDSLLLRHLKPHQRRMYEIRRCTKNGGKLMKYHNDWCCTKLDAWLASGRLQQ